MTERQKVTFLELPVFAGVVPLVSGYIEAYSRNDPLLARSFAFEKISLPVKSPYAAILSRLEQSDADVYAFSCYLWNARLVRRLLDALLAVKPQAHYVLGGPQVMHQGARYLTPQRENVFVCNGEGERTFSGFLRTLLSERRDFTAVRGLSFYRGGQLVTTDPEPRISDLSEIPSPFLEGMFEKGVYTWMLIETNRGCPFKCNYCFWGAATGAKVYKYDDERVERELEWISESGCWYLFIADANWGMLKRDVDLTRFLVEAQKRHGAPTTVYFCGSKNTPDRVVEITKILHDAGLIAVQSVALQTMNAETLRRVDRANIRTSTYTELQQSLNRQGISSFIELIWPLPGETLASYQEGIGSLCELGADHFMVYPLMLMNNVELASKRQEFGMVTVRDPDPRSEAEMVVSTNEVTTADYREGIRYTYAVTSTYSIRGLWCLAHYLHRRGLVKYADLFRAFVEFSRVQPAHPYTVFCEKSIRAFEHAVFTNTGAFVHLILHAERDAFDDLLARFVAAQDFWQDPLAQFSFELDLVNRPYVYSNTRIAVRRYEFRHLRVAPAPGGYLVDVPPHCIEHLHEHVAVQGGDGSGTRFVLTHKRAQLPFMPAKSLDEHYVYCHDCTQRMGPLMPAWQRAAAPVDRGLAAAAV